MNSSGLVFSCLWELEDDSQLVSVQVLSLLGLVGQVLICQVIFSGFWFRNYAMIHLVCEKSLFHVLVPL